MIFAANDSTKRARFEALRAKQKLQSLLTEGKTVDAKAVDAAIADLSQDARDLLLAEAIVIEALGGAAKATDTLHGLEAELASSSPMGVAQFKNFLQDVAAKD